MYGKQTMQAVRLIRKVEAFNGPFKQFFCHVG
jgi:hypothetical protein